MIVPQVISPIREGFDPDSRGRLALSVMSPGVISIIWKVIVKFRNLAGVLKKDNRICTSILRFIAPGPELQHLKVGYAWETLKLCTKLLNQALHCLN